MGVLLSYDGVHEQVHLYGNVFINVIFMRISVNYAGKIRSGHNSFPEKNY